MGRIIGFGFILVGLLGLLLPILPGWLILLLGFNLFFRKRITLK
ncbi:hypothetical protein [Caldisalinibacter kiritimatiensis]|uniref:Uncharacterized protein n=1 Tax=Caldisalinibacter kiritimatiensis TaxID=1304284 RepID=R1AQW7_9FIRM|nr:hypothetical protein [Caldisalinibacter kiritimatiensis]EOC99512.1 hypothetical protein L21TH_2424 [Caldisalinibacter kiritimatiensis]